MRSAWRVLRHGSSVPLSTQPRAVPAPKRRSGRLAERQDSTKHSSTSLRESVCIGVQPIAAFSLSWKDDVTYWPVTFTELTPDPDTLAHLGQLVPMAGFLGGEGLDLHPVAKGSTTEPTTERYESQPIDP